MRERIYRLCQEVIDLLPERFEFTIHNVIGHPLSELLHQLGFEDLADDVHSFTAPEKEEDIEIMQQTSEATSKAILWTLADRHWEKGMDNEGNVLFYTGEAKN